VTSRLATENREPFFYSLLYPNEWDKVAAPVKANSVKFRGLNSVILKYLKAKSRPFQVGYFSSTNFSLNHLNGLLLSSLFLKLYFYHLYQKHVKEGKY
jgi:hypothetical protein